MKKLLFVILVLCTFFGVSSLARALEFENGYITINSNVIKDISPNQAEISFSVQTFDRVLKNASDENTKVSNKVYSVLKAIIGANDYIKTGQFSARPEYIYTKDNKRILEKFIVTNSVSVKTKNISLVPKLIDTAISQGATGVDSLNFIAVDYDEICSDNLAELTKKAYAQANKVARSINSQIIGVKSISTSCTTENQQRPYYPMMAKATIDAVSSASTPIESGKIKLNINVDAAFYVK